MKQKQTQSLAARTADQIFQMIIAEPGFASGDKLPNENQLAATFGISRTTLREAIHSLSVQGIVEVRRGLGTFVLMDTNIKQDIGLGKLGLIKVRLKDLFELRMMFEPQTAMLACRRASDEEIRKISNRARDVKRLIQKKQDYAEADLRFHEEIVNAAHNEFMSNLMPIINSAINDTWTMCGELKELPGIVLQDNELILDCLRKRDSEGVRHAMALHMRHLIATLRFEDDSTPVY